MSDKLAQQFAQRLFEAQTELALIERDIALFAARRDALVEYIAASERIAEQLATRRNDLGDAAIRIGNALREASAAFLDRVPPAVAREPHAGEPASTFGDISRAADAAPAKARKARRQQPPGRRAEGSLKPAGPLGDLTSQGAPAPNELDGRRPLSEAERAILDILRNQSRPVGVGDIAEEAGLHVDAAKPKPPLRDVLQTLQRENLVERVGHKWRIAQQDEILAVLFSR